MSVIKVQEYASPLGVLVIGVYEKQLVICDWKYRKMRTAIDDRIQSALDANYVKQPDRLIDTVITQLEEYFLQRRKTFDVPLRMIGTDFQQDVWKQLCNIPYGATNSYIDLAKKIQNVKAVRAVATANAANAMAVIIPCHRIIGSDGNLVGYAGGLVAKKKLLALENSIQQQELFV